MALFKRNKKNTDVLPAEVREYYQSERRDRAGVAWLLALGTLLLTFVIAAALFFGGRWLYNAVFDKDTETTQTTSQDDSLRVDEKGNVIGGNQAATPSTKPLQGSTGTSSTNTTTPSSTPAATPNTGDMTPAELVNTGPGDE